MKKTALIVLVSLAALWFFNPELERHKEKVSAHYGSGLVGKFARLVLEVGGLRYHDFLLFSTTTGAGGELVSIGFLGKVIVITEG